MRSLVLPRGPGIMIAACTEGEAHHLSLKVKQAKICSKHGGVPPSCAPPTSPIASLAL